MSEKLPGNGQSVGVIGAGLVGCVTAIAFAKKGYNVTIFEMRDDPSTNKQTSNLRSINLAISDRGIRTLRSIDDQMSNELLANMIPMKGRMIHNLKGEEESQLYGLFGECINSIDRNTLNIQLLDIVKSLNIAIHFNHKLNKVDFDLDFPKAWFNDTIEYEFDFLVGCDGAHSRFRYELQKKINMNYTQEYIDMIYIELYLPPGSSDDKFQIDKNHLHIWPRHNYMLIALANQDGSFTLTFFSSLQLVKNLNNDPKKIISFFKENFCDIYSKIDNDDLIVKSFQSSSIAKNSLLCVECSKYNYKGKGIILGDAAHAMVPFYGQGMNCGFEDVRILMELLRSNNYQAEKSFGEYSENRVDDLRAIIQLAKDNYKEMSSKVTSKTYLIRKKIDFYLGKLFKGKWIPLYTMISFRGDIPYSKAISINKRQTQILNNIQVGVWTLIVVGGFAFGKTFGPYLNRK